MSYLKKFATSGADMIWGEHLTNLLLSSGATLALGVIRILSCLFSNIAGANKGRFRYGSGLYRLMMSRKYDELGKP